MCSASYRHIKVPISSYEQQTVACSLCPMAMPFRQVGVIHPCAINYCTQPHQGFYQQTHPVRNHMELHMDGPYCVNPPGSQNPEGPGAWMSRRRLEMACSIRSWVHSGIYHTTEYVHLLNANFRVLNATPTFATELKLIIALCCSPCRHLPMDLGPFPSG